MSDQDILDRLTAYRERGLAQVTGWFEGESAEVIGLLLAHQLELGVTGNVAEIGVHHGKSFLLLANGLRRAEQAFALDVFGDQDKNLDRSGLGDRAAFESNVAAWAPDADVSILQLSSLEVTPASALDTFGEVRVMSIDGGHTAAITAHDLRLAEACVAERGIVVLDDLLNPHWMGVLSGFGDYFGSGARLTPFAYSPNKLYLSPSPVVATAYAARLREVVPDLLGKPNVEFFGHQVDVYGQGSLRRRRQAQEESATRDQLTVARRRGRRLDRELADARRRVAEMEASTSWRMTTPARRATDWLRKLR